MPTSHSSPGLPPGVDRPGAFALRRLWAAVGDAGLVQVAEQYPPTPVHAARLAVVRAGVIGTPTQVQVSSTQRYHAVSLIRTMLGVGHEPAVVRASRTTAPLVDPLDRAGWTDDPTPKPAVTTLAALDFGAGSSGLYGFTTNQTRSLLRFRRMLIRGTHGEIHDDGVVRLSAPRTIVRSPLVRRQTGHDLDLTGYDTETVTLDGEVLYRNQFPGERLNDDECATASMLRAMAHWVRGHGPPPYPLTDGAQDHLIALAVERAADAGRTVTTTAEPWP